MAAKKTQYVAVETATLHPGRTVELVKGEVVDLPEEQLEILLANGHVREVAEGEDVIDPKVDEAHQAVVDQVAGRAVQEIADDAGERGIEEVVTIDVTEEPPGG